MFYFRLDPAKFLADILTHSENKTYVIDTLVSLINGTPNTKSAIEMWDEAKLFKEKKSLAGKIGNEKRWVKNVTLNDKNDESNVSLNLSQCDTSAILLRSQTIASNSNSNSNSNNKKTNTKKESKEKKSTPFLLLADAKTHIKKIIDNEKFFDLLESWLDVRYAKGNKTTLRSLELSAKTLQGVSEETALYSLEMAVAGGWQGIFVKQKPIEYKKQNFSGSGGRIVDKWESMADNRFLSENRLNSELTIGNYEKNESTDIIDYEHL